MEHCKLNRRAIGTIANNICRYHSQSPESLFTHIPGLRVVMPRSPSQAKGLLAASIASNDPVIFMEPKNLYRASREEVPVDPYTLPLSKAEILKPGKDVTVISYGAPLYTCSDAITHAEKDFGCSVELIDLRTIYPWDRPTILESVKKTGRAVVVHESMVNAGVGAEVAATIQEQCFLRLEAPVQRVAGWSTHVGLVYEKFLMPDVVRKYHLSSRSVRTLTSSGGVRCYQKSYRILGLKIDKISTWSQPNSSSVLLPALVNRQSLQIQPPSTLRWPKPSLDLTNFYCL